MKTSDEKYLEELHIALRWHDLSGARVGEVLAEVETHLNETGEDPVRAFGRPREYAALVVDALPPNSGKMSTAEKIGGAFTTGVLAYFGVSFLSRGLAGGAVTYTPVDAVSSAVLLVLILLGVALFLRSATAVEAKNRRSYGIGGAVAVLAAIASAGVAHRLVDEGETLFELPAAGGIAIGAALLLVVVVMLAKAIKRGKVVDPR